VARRHVRPWLLAVAVLLGCGRETPPKATAPDGAGRGEAPRSEPAGPCDYMTATDAARLLKQPTRFRPQASIDRGCTLEPDSSDAFRGASVDFAVTRGDTRAYDFLAAQKSSVVVELGDKARWLAAGRSGGNLVVVQGRDVLSLTIRDFRFGADVQAEARVLARRLLKGLLRRGS
jgi:hypothetical protein